MHTANPLSWAETFQRLFSLSADEREHLRQLTASSEEVEPRRKLIIEGRPCEGLFILTSGWVAEAKLLRSGKRQILNFRLPGDILGVECLAYKAALHSTVTLTRCTVARLQQPASRTPSAPSRALLPRSSS